MEQLIVNVTDKEKAEMLSQILTSLDFVNSVELMFEATITSQEEDFFSLAGIWENRDITIESIREQAWQEEIK